MNTVSVIGLGDVLAGGDDFSPLALENFRCEYECPPSVAVLDLGTPGIDLAPYLYDKELVIVVDVVDAVDSGTSSGVGSIFCEEDFVSQRARLCVTGHERGLWDSLAHLRMAGHAPEELIIVGVHPKACALAGAVSDEVWNRASRAAEMIAISLLERGITCFPRQPPATPNLWWLGAGNAEGFAV